MKTIVPVVEHSGCQCGEENLRIVLDYHGFKELTCVEHGPAMRVGRMEFDNEKAYRKWLDES